MADVEVAHGNVFLWQRNSTMHLWKTCFVSLEQRQICTIESSRIIYTFSQTLRSKRRIVIVNVIKMALQVLQCFSWYKLSVTAMVLHFFQIFKKNLQMVVSRTFSSFVVRKTVLQKYFNIHVFNYVTHINHFKLVGLIRLWFSNYSLC